MLQQCSLGKLLPRLLKKLICQKTWQLEGGAYVSIVKSFKIFSKWNGPILKYFSTDDPLGRTLQILLK